MESVREYLTKLKTGGNHDDNDDDCDQELLRGPTINIAPGQVKEDVHYMESRGSIDLSEIRFYAEDQPEKRSFGIHFPTNSTSDETENQALVDDNGDETSFGRVEEPFVDIAVFEVPEHCTSENCDLSKVRLILSYNATTTTWVDSLRKAHQRVYKQVLVLIFPLSQSQSHFFSFFILARLAFDTHGNTLVRSRIAATF